MSHIENNASRWTRDPMVKGRIANIVIQEDNIFVSSAIIFALEKYGLLGLASHPNVQTSENMGSQENSSLRIPPQEFLEEDQLIKAE